MLTFAPLPSRGTSNLRECHETRCCRCSARSPQSLPWAARYGACSRPAISIAADQDHRVAGAGRRRRHHRARVRGEARRGRRDRGGGKPHRRGRRDRRRRRGEIGARRLHVLHGLPRHAVDPAAPQSQAALRSGQGFSAGRVHRHLAERADRASVDPGEDAAGAGRLHQGQSRQAELRLAGHRQLRAISRASSSSNCTASTSRTCTIAARRQRCRTWWPAMST